MSTRSTEFLDLQTALAGEYSLERELGRGGMGVVYLARDVQLDRHVAIKVLPAHLAEQPDARERFLREARTAAGLSHPNIVPIHRVGEAAGFVFFVMSYVAGVTLGERLRAQGPLVADEAARVLREVAWALAYAHGRGIVHRDVKPDNILLEEGSSRALVTDFGIAHVGSTTTLNTDPGRIMGTAQFMSPEQAMSEAVDGRSDLYSLGAVGYLAVSGKLPFEAANLPALLMKHVSEPARSVAHVAPGLPHALVEAIDRCLEKNPADRHESGEALAAALAPSTFSRPELPAPLRSWISERNPATVAYAVWSGLTLIPTLGAHGIPELPPPGIPAGNCTLGPAGCRASRADHLLPREPRATTLQCGFHAARSSRRTRRGGARTTARAGGHGAREPPSGRTIPSDRDVRVPRTLGRPHPPSGCHSAGPGTSTHRHPVSRSPGGGAGRVAHLPRTHPVRQLEPRPAPAAGHAPSPPEGLARATLAKRNRGIPCAASRCPDGIATSARGCVSGDGNGARPGSR